MVSFDLSRLKLNKIPIKKLSLEKISLKKAVIYLSAIICAAAVITGISVKTHNDGKEAPNNKIQLVTRTPIDSRGFFFGINPKAGILLSWHDRTIKLEEDSDNTERLGGELYPVTLPDTTLTYTSSNESVAEVDSKGNITPKNPGSIEISVKNDYTGEQAKAFVQVVQPVTGFYLEKSTINLYTTDMGVRLKAEVLPENASNTTIQWYSKDTGIVEVDQDGGLTPISTGMTEIVATTTDGGFSGKCFVNVINEVIKAKTVTVMNKEKVSLKVGDTWDGIASVLPANAKNKTVEWTTDNEKIATVTKTGKVHAVGEGTVHITATSPDGPSDTVTITVKGKVNTQLADTNKSYSAGGGVVYTSYNMTLDEMAQKMMSTSPTYNGGSATTELVKNYLDPNRFIAGAYKYQFMDLSHYNGISRDALAAFLEGKGTLSGQADAFIEAAKEYNVSELYLVAHACHETGNGSSQLATGVEVNGVRVYNMYGIAAYDNSAVASGSSMAYSSGWTSPSEAIKGGAKWISENYINRTDGRQNTLYKMRWNPENPGTHTYATNVSWAVSQTVVLEKLFEKFPNASISYDIPVYSGSNAAVIDTTTN